MKKHNFSRRSFLVASAGAATTWAAGSGVYAQTGKTLAGKTLHVQFWAGPEGDALTKNVVEPFKAATGANVVIDHGVTNESIAKIRAQKSDPQIDLFMMDDVGVYETAPQGLLEKLDFSKIPNAKDIDPAFVVMDGMGIGVFTYWVSLIYNSDIIKQPPASYDIMWDPKYRGKVAVPPSNNQAAPKLIIVAALLAGGNQQNPDPGFKKLKELKPNVHSFTEDYSIQAELMRKGEIALMFDGFFAIQPYLMKGYPIKPSFEVKEGIFITPDIVAMIKGHPDSADVAEAFINTALSVDAQVGLVADLGYGPTNKNVKVSDPRISAEMKPYILTSEHFNNRVTVDAAALAKVRQDWITRYDEALKG